MSTTTTPTALFTDNLDGWAATCKPGSCSRSTMKAAAWWSPVPRPAGMFWAVSLRVEEYLRTYTDGEQRLGTWWIIEDFASLDEAEIRVAELRDTFARNDWEDLVASGQFGVRLP